MNRFLYAALCVSASCLQASSIIHKSLDYVKPESKAAVRESAVEIRNVDLAQTTIAYKNWLENGTGNLRDLITPETEEKGLPVLGYIALDIDTSRDTETTKDLNSVKRFAKTFVIHSSVREFAHRTLPQWLEAEYDPLHEQILSIAKKKEYDFLGEESIRLTVADYIVQTWHKQNSGKKKYVHHKKGIDASAAIQTEQKNIEDILSRAQNAFRHVGDIENNPIDEYTECIIVPASDLKNQPTVITLQNTLNPQTGNPNLKVIVAFDDQMRSTTRFFKVPHHVENLIVTGLNIDQIGNYFLTHHVGLKVDLSSLSPVEKVGNYFFATCDAQEINLSALSQVREVGSFFLSGCDELKKIDLSPLSRLQEVGDYFLHRCDSLEKIIIHRNLYDLLIRQDSDFFSGFPKLKPENIKIID